mmetsp:Transcript_45750/g.85415  ORF Transcript_45750/g.85415 Transcript_45750/m.85415 type:complete len:181 (+) Transcript_45750:24-566(+)
MIMMMSCCSAGILCLSSIKRCHARPASSHVRLNVGGYIFRCEKSTVQKCKFISEVLTADPHAMEWFLDRDGRLFEYIHAYLKDESCFVPPTDPAVLRQLASEAASYGLRQLQAKLLKAPERLEVAAMDDSEVWAQKVLVSCKECNAQFCSLPIPKSTYRRAWTVGAHASQDLVPQTSIGA